MRVSDWTCFGPWKRCPMLLLPTLLLSSTQRQESRLGRARLGNAQANAPVQVQRYRSNPLSLLSNFQTDVYVYSCSKIPRPPSSAQEALRASTRKCKKAPDAREQAYVPWLYHNISKDACPTEAEFQALATTSLTIKEKFR